MKKWTITPNDRRELFDKTEEISLGKFNEKVLIKPFQGHLRSKLRKRSEYDEFNLNGLQSEHPPVSEWNIGVCNFDL